MVQGLKGQAYTKKTPSCFEVFVEASHFRTRSIRPKFG